MTGAGAGSIGAEVLQGLLSGGAKVVVTTSRFSREVTEYYQSMYTKFGSRGSQMILCPFNQGSKQDVEALVNYIYDGTKNGLGWDLDFVIPFAAISTNGREIDGLDSRAELAHRIMLTNLLRLLGMIKTNKAARGYETRPAQVILPLSPNHGTFGNDGLYSESKLALETLFNRWHSESWSSYLNICGAVIGWTRGTGLMSGNNIIAEGIEKFGVRTFSQQEMAFNILGLMAPAMVNLCQMEPVFADLNGALQYIPNLNELSSKLRQNLLETSEIRKAVTSETAIEHKIVNGDESERLHQKVTVQPRANMKFEFPVLPDYKAEIEQLAATRRGMVDLDKVVVVAGFAEVGPWGNARTRWEMEAYGKFSLEGCIEMAWMMGLIKNFKGPIKGKQYAGWVDAKTGEPIDDKDVKPKYEKHILEHSGIRLIESELFGGYDPNKKEVLQEIAIEEDMEPFEASKETAEEFARQHDDKVEVFELESGEYSVRLKKGATLLVPKALKFDRLVAGQVPTGWDARRFGIPEDIISQVDPVTLYVLVSVAESMISAGITDPYEFYQYVHLSEVGNCLGSGVGGMTALRGMYRGRYVDKPVQKDVLQESFINTMAAWVNMLLLSSTGPIKTPVGACATAVESLDIGYETIVEGKARVCFVGGFDDFQEEGSYEFANMKATSNAVEELAHGRTPSEMSRPTTTTRSGFMESQGCGVQLIMSAKLALDMGVPIYGIVAMTATATDKIGRSVPAPGQGILTTARESGSRFPSPLLDMGYRKRQLELRKTQIKQWTETELLYLNEEVAAMKAQGVVGFDEREYLQDRAAHLEKEALRQEREALSTWGNDFWKRDPKIAPLRGALATWGLTIDDLGVASFHGTSTKANDKNESDALNKMMLHLGRTKGNALLGIFQKHLTGHPKGAAGAWMMNGGIQCLNSGVVPGNRNADNVDADLEKFEFIVYPSRSIQTDGIKAFSVTSFGFGQKGAQAIGVHPKYLYATLDEATYNAYRARVGARYKKAYRYYHTSLVENNLFQAKAQPPYTADQESSVFLDPLARVEPNRKAGSYTYPVQISRKADPSLENTRKLVEQLAKHSAQGSNTRVGVDAEHISSMNMDNENFIERNFTAAEIEYCRAAASPQASFAGRWSAKESVFKSLGVAGKGAGAPLKEIEILSDEKGAPYVLVSELSGHCYFTLPLLTKPSQLHGDAQRTATEAGVQSVQVSISHSDTQAIAVAIASLED